MRRPFHFIVTLIVFAALLSGASGATAQDSGPQPSLVPEGGSPLTTAFTYQGVLKQGTTPFNGTCQKLDFYLFDIANPPNGYPQLGLIQLTGVQVSNGLLNVSLNFGAGAFNGDRRWLQIQHDCNNTGGTFIMTPTQELTANPYTLFSTQAGNATLLDGQDSSAFSLTGHAHSGSDITSGTVAEARIHGDITRDTEVMVIVLNNDGSGSTLNADLLDGLDSLAFAATGHNHDATYVNENQADSITSAMILNGTVSSGDMQDGTALAEIIDDDGTGSTLDADLLDGLDSLAFAATGHNHDLIYVNENQADSITTGMITDGQVSSADLADGTVTSTDLADGTVVSADIADGTVTSTDLADGTVTSADIADGTVVSADIADGTVVSADVNNTSIQLRVTGTCSGDASLRTINADGTVVCQTNVPLPGFAVTPLDSAGDVGRHTSIIIGADGLALVSYYDASNTALKVLHCSDIACTTSTLTTLDNAATVGQYSSVTIGADGLGLISYHDATNTALNVAHCSNIECTSATITTLDNTADVGLYTSIAIGADGLGLISYYDFTNGDLKVAHCSDIVCTNTTAPPATPDSTGDVGLYTSITIGADKQGLISYYDASNGDLKVAHCTDVVTLACATASAFTVDPINDSGRYSSVTIGQDGLGLISYYDAGITALILAHCSSVTCATATSAIVVDAVGDVGQYTSVTIGQDGLPLISYYDATNGNLKIAHCPDQACAVTPRTIVLLDGVLTDVGQFTSATVGVDGLPLISYFAAGTANDFKVAHCSNQLCIPYFRRR